MRELARKLRRNERGMSLVFVALGLMPLLAATTLAIDLGMVMTARTQAQSSADSAALAGAVALTLDDYSDRSASGPAVQSALNTARANNVMGLEVNITPEDVTFPLDPNGQPNWVSVDVFRTAARGNPVTTLVASIFGIANVDIEAAATAETVPANTESCVKPWAIPDKWTERQTPAWDVGDTFTAFPKSPSILPDIFQAASDPAYTGYRPQIDRGLQLTLTPVSTNTIKPNMYYALQLPGSSGNNDFQNNISGCDGTRMHPNDSLTVEPLANATDTALAVADLIAQDPSAYWDTGTNRVVSSKGRSPRIVVVPVYDPYYFDQGKRVGNFTNLRISNFIGFFVEELQGSDVVGRIVPISGSLDGVAGPAPAGAFPRAIRLVR